MKTQYYTASSLDGFIATEDDSLDWLFPLGDLDNSSYPEFISNVGALAMGSATYEWIVRNADKVADETGSPWPYTQPLEKVYEFIADNAVCEVVEENSSHGKKAIIDNCKQVAGFYQTVTTHFEILNVISEDNRQEFAGIFQSWLTVS